MKKLILIVSLMLGSAVHADQVPAWQQKLEAYRASLADSTNAGLRVRYGFYAGMALTTCALSTAVTAATFVADTVPVANVVSESLANVTAPDYQTYQNILEWKTSATSAVAPSAAEPLPWSNRLNSSVCGWAAMKLRLSKP